MTRLLFLCLGLVLASPLFAANPPPNLESRFALVLDENGKVLLNKNADVQTPIASITKLMTALVVMEANQSMDEVLTVTEADRDSLKNTYSRLNFGGKLTRREMLTIALSSSENRAASALGRHYPGGIRAFIQAMNAKAKLLGMTNSYFADSTGLNPQNVSTARDLAKLVHAAMAHPFIREASTTPESRVYPFATKPPLEYRITNRFVQGNNADWNVYLSKTGYIQEAGRCLAMNAQTAGHRLTIVLLNANGKLSPYGDSNRIRQWLNGEPITPIARPAPAKPADKAAAKQPPQKGKPVAKAKPKTKPKPKPKPKPKAKVKG